MQVGDTARRTRTITARDIELFTQLTGDRNPLHYDPDLARFMSEDPLAGSRNLYTLRETTRSVTLIR